VSARTILSKWVSGALPGLRLRKEFWKGIRFVSILCPTPPRGDLELQGFDAAYLERLRRGDPETERQFAAYFGRLVIVKLRSRLRSWSLIEDIRQETLLRVLKAVRATVGIREPERLGSFVNSVCNNVVLEFLRAETRHRPTADEPDSRPGPARADPEAGLVSEERKELVRRILAELPERDRQILSALFLEDRDKDEICAKFGVDRDYLRVLLHRAKGHFRAHYMKEAMPPARVASLGRGRAPWWRSSKRL
jgi:RNA polymerase sigma-70 factor, ECF subfamily